MNNECIGKDISLSYSDNLDYKKGDTILIFNTPWKIIEIFKEELKKPEFDTPIIRDFQNKYFLKNICYKVISENEIRYVMLRENNAALIARDYFPQIGTIKVTLE